MSLVEFRKEGIYIPAADVFIDPWRRVKNALITHGHSDHSRWGHQNYLCTHQSKPIIRHRLGDVKVESVDYGEVVKIKGVKFSFLPAGHIIGSAQIRIEYKGEIWVVSGDYKVEDDGISGKFEPVKCHTFVTESTFGLPIYSWLPQSTIFDQINQWWSNNRQNKTTTLLTGYTLGKAQRLLSGIDPTIGPIYTHGAIENMNTVVKATGVSLPHTEYLRSDVPKSDLEGALVLAPTGSTGSNWMRRFREVSVGSASGWMQLRGARRRGGADRGFVLSDHADWEGLNQAIKATGAERIYVTHGYTDIFRKWLETQGYEAHIVKTKFGGEQSESDLDVNEKEGDA
ncbi:MAG: ligase-associated DNA damage response exonuclease [Saprospiraceae bacterium]|nr:ligase-associated DNA damage response exonuclease [Saprospiraceae bacterium]